MEEQECLKQINDLDTEINVLKERRSEITSRIYALTSKKEKLMLQYEAKSMQDNKVNDHRVWTDTKFDWSDKLIGILKEKFKFEKFRSVQLSAINATLSKRDVLLVMPTGGGKSLVYQLPALVDKNLTLVVSPLVSLIDDQLRALKEIGIEAVTLNSSSSKKDKNYIYETITQPSSKIKLLYVTPEWAIKSKIFMNKLQKCYEKGNLDRIVIDEVHCCTTWGHDFRPEYQQLGLFKTMFVDIPILGLTATATMPTLVEIQKSLCLNRPLVFSAPFNRPNLYYKVVSKPSEKDKCIDYLEHLLKRKFKGKSGIIYSSTVNECVVISQSLVQRGISVRPYFAAMDNESKKNVQQRWLNNELQAIVATIAFGMGIDKPDVHFVIHHCIPKSIEGYYQESGRAGRNGEKSHCILMFGLGDHLKNVRMCNSKRELDNTKSILGYSLNKKMCRREYIADHFEDTEKNCEKMCDICESPHQLINYDITPAYKDIIRLIEVGGSKEIKFTLNKLINTWFQTGNKELRIPGLKVPKCTKSQAEDIITFLLYKDYLSVDKAFNLYTSISYVVKGKKTSEMIVMSYDSNLHYSIISISDSESADEDKTEPTSKRIKLYDCD